jgi:hypothetical protein
LNSRFVCYDIQLGQCDVGIGLSGRTIDNGNFCDMPLAIRIDKAKRHILNRVARSRMYANRVQITNHFPWQSWQYFFFFASAQDNNKRS